MRPLFYWMVLVTEGFASWTLAYHLALYFRFPAWMSLVPFLAFLSVLLAGSWRAGSRLSLVPLREWGFAGAVLGLAGGVGFLALCVANFNPDDYNFFHRALTQLDRMGQPFVLTETGLRPEDLPHLSALHVMTSYEPAMAFAARTLGVDPLGFFQNGGTLLGVLLLTTVLALLYRQFRLGPWMALAATLGAIIYLATDARLPRSYGNILLYCWNGKVILWGVWMPWTLFLTVRFLLRPCRDRWILLMLAGVCAVGLSGTGLFLFPVEVLCVTAAYFLLARGSRKRMRRVILANAAGGYCLAIVVLALAGLFPRPSNIEAWTQAWPGVWWKNLGLVFSSRDVIFRDVLLVFVLPLVALTRTSGRMAVLLGVAALLLVANPLVGPFWIRRVTPGAYWRFAFLLPMAWYAGLVAPALLRRQRAALGAVVGRCVAVVALVAIVVVGRHSVLWPPDRVQIKHPLELRLPQPEGAFARQAASLLHGRYVLGPEGLCACAALLEPAARFYAVRGTGHFFANAGTPDEGRRRVAAQQAVSKADAGESALNTVLREALVRGVDAVMLADVQPLRSRVTRQLDLHDPNRWQVAAACHGYVLFLREVSASMPEGVR